MLREAGDLRASATPAFTPADAALPSAISSIYGSQAPFGSPSFAARESGDITGSITKPPADPIPGWLATGSLWPNQRFVLRVPRAWNGRLVVAGCPGQRTEYACDRLFSDPLIARGYAYACGNKGNGDGAALLAPDARLAVGGVALPRYALRDGRSVAFWQHARGARIERWLDEMLELVPMAHELIARAHGRAPELTYAIGLSNGGYQVRRAIEESALFAGALTWNAVLWTPRHNLLRSLVQAVAAMAGGEPQRLAQLGFPADLPAESGNGSLYAKNLAVYWHVTLWLHAAHVDPAASIAYGDVDDAAPAEALQQGLERWRGFEDPAVERRIAGFSNTGAIGCKLIELASEYDHLIPPVVHFEPYRELVRARGRLDRYRSRIVAGASHVESWADDPEYPQLRFGHGEVLAAWDELVRWVE